MTGEGWTAEKAFQEMKQFKFEGFPGHPVLKNFVYAYHPAPKTENDLERYETELNEFAVIP
jgi:hypothetical protein